MLKLRKMADKLLSQMVTITAKFISASTGLFLNDENFEFQLFDKDIIKDDFLGSCKLNSKGEAILSFDRRQLKSFDSPTETKPDLWFSLSDGAKEVYKSKTLENLDLKKHANFSVDEGYRFNLGTYIISV